MNKLASKRVYEYLMPLDDGLQGGQKVSEKKLIFNLQEHIVAEWMLGKCALLSILEENLFET